jgi:carboxypeptidase family protein/TonB-dependent receptor-like protein
MQLTRCFLVRIVSAVFVLLAAPSIVTAQSAISGLVRDSSGAVLPGVTVEAASPVLIEKVRSVVSDDQGRYTIIDLRPGTYSVTFTLTGFNTLKRDGIELPGNFTATVNAELPVGSLEESITVSGDAPIVDTQSTQRTHVITRDQLDSLPTARNYSGLAALLPGVRMTNTDVGGNQQIEQIYMTVHGSRRTDTTLQVDGMSINSLMNDGEVQAYFSDAANAEVTYQTSGASADVSTGGVKVNMIPREGGNRFSGSAFVGGSNESWQSSNVTDELRQRGLAAGNRIALISDINFGLGGPIKRDKLWFFATWRRIATNDIVANSFYKDGTPGQQEQWVQNQLVRLTWQMTPRNKFTVYHDRYPKFKGHEMGALTDPETASYRRDPQRALYYTGQAKWTSPVTSRLLLEAGYSTNVEYVTLHYQPGVARERGTADWYNTIGKRDLLLLTNYDGVPDPTYGVDPKKYVITGSAAYVTGSHSLRTGVQWGFGDYVIDRDINGDLVQLYRNGVADSVRVFNTPVRSHEYLNADLGVYAQDSWTMKKLTLNLGVRFEYFNGEISQQDVAAGRFVPRRQFDEVSRMPNWLDVAPRLGVAYDLFGNSRTALKATLNKYMAGQTLGFAQRYNPLQLQSDVRTWNDVNRDDIARDNEVGASNNRAFGLPVLQRRPADDIKREFDLEYSAGIQHELVRGVSVTGAWYRRGTYNMVRTTPTEFSPSDYTIVNVASPLDGSIIPAYNLNPSKNDLLGRLDSNSTDPDLQRQTYNGFEFGVAGRYRRGSAFGGWTFDRRILVHCAELENWSNLPTTAYTSLTQNLNQPKADYHFCDQSKLDIPYLHEFKLAGTYLLPWWDIQANATFQSYPGTALPTRWSISQTTRYAADCIGPCTPGALVIPNLTPASYVLDLTAPGSVFYKRQNQLDVGVRKIFRIRQMQFSGQVDVFNATNSSYVKLQNTTIGPSLGQPLSILQPRLLRLAVQMRF